MFTGIITDIGKVLLTRQDRDLRARIETHYPLSEIAIGASIACDGVCLTVVEKADDWFEVDISEETLTKTNIRQVWQSGASINLERPLRLGDELGGHIVSGHVDGLAEVLSVSAVAGSTCIRFRAPDDLAKFIAPKGSVALNGTSLTVNDVAGSEFTVNLIPHTQEVTTWGDVTEGDLINLEIDTLARYVARMNEV
ncbi:riboflavin synthase [Halovulum sp. GXIMD14793]